MFKIGKKRYDLICLLTGKHDYKKSGFVNLNGKIKIRYICSRCRDIKYD